MIKTNKKSAFTLIELTIAMALFAMMSVMATQVYSNIVRMSKKVEINEYVFTEANAVMAKILQEVERGTIDYEEYYSRIVLGETYYGQNYGAYKSAFYDPGSNGPFVSPADYNAGDGICCSTGCATEYFFGYSCVDFDVATYDVNMGSYPYDGLNVERYNSVCTGSLTCDDIEYTFQDELYLIDSAGTRKVIFAEELKDNGESYLSMIELVGFDEDGDGVNDFWGCGSDYDCQDGLHGLDVPEADLDLNDGFDTWDFLAISPTNIDIIDLSFYIAPLEDPFRAFAEGEGAVQQHPHVIVTMTVGPSEDLTLDYLGSDWTLTLQGTASAGVFDAVPSEYRGGDWRW